MMWTLASSLLVLNRLTVSMQLASSAESCPDYNHVSMTSIAGNGQVLFSVVKIKSKHLTDSSMYSAEPTEKDNTMITETACAFGRMAKSAKQAGVNIKISSGFRTIARQQYFWDCYQIKNCNGGRQASRPGTSNHGRGIALDLNTNCGGQSGPVPACDASVVYQWLKHNAHNNGFTRTVRSELWHWEYVGGTASPANFS